MKQKLRYLRCCIDWPRNDVHVEGGLCDMIDEALGITRRTFLLHTDRDDRIRLERGLGYEADARRGLTINQDFLVSYHRSRLHGKRVYYLRNSAIEYVFTTT